jgi:hypothetical protein
MQREQRPQADAPSDANVAAFDLIYPMIEAAHKEMSELSKKKQDGILNELKIRHVNRLLDRAKDVLGSDASVEFVEVLDEETLPQNSDAVLVIGQWLAAMSQFKDRHFGFDNERHVKRWFTKERPHPGSEWDEYEEEEEEEDKN